MSEEKQNTMLNIRSKACPAEVWENAELAARKRGCTTKTKSATLEWILNDYFNLYIVQSINEPVLISHIKANQAQLHEQFEKRLASSMFRLMSEQAIEMSILGQMMIKDIYSNLSESEIKARWHTMRQAALEEFRSTGKIMSWKEYLEMAEDDEAWQD